MKFYPFYLNISELILLNLNLTIAMTGPSLDFYLIFISKIFYIEISAVCSYN